MRMREACHDEQVMDASLPFAFEDGWPMPLPGRVVRAQETSIALGLQMLGGFRTPLVDPSTTLTVLVENGHVLSPPIALPERVMSDPSDLQEWIWDTHAATGRLLVYPSDGSWWIVEDADWEVVFVCGAIDFVERVSDAIWLDSWRLFDWLPLERLDPGARDEARMLAARYDLPLATPGV